MTGTRMNPQDEALSVTQEPRPCPFCATAMSYCSDKDGEFWMHPGTVTDGDCFMSGQGIFPRQLAAWNTRLSHSTPGDAEVLRKALEPFALEASDYDNDDGEPDYKNAPDESALEEINDLTVGHLRRARKAWSAAGYRLSTPTSQPPAAETRLREALLPCPLPWCESKDAPKLYDGLPSRGCSPIEFAVACDDCDISTPQFATAAEAIDCWNTNTRAALTQPEPTAQQGGEEGRSASVAEEWTAYMDEAVSKAPEPLRRLGGYLAGLLDEDQWKTAERYLNAAALSSQQATDEAQVSGTFSCPICGKDTPHYHSPQEVDDHNETESWVEESLQKFRALEAERKSAQQAATDEGAMRDALEPFAMEASEYDNEDGEPDYKNAPDESSLEEFNDLTVGDLRRARKAWSALGYALATPSGRAQGEENFYADLYARGCGLIGRLRTALQPFAGIKADDGDDFSSYPDDVIIRVETTAGDIKAAREAMEDTVLVLPAAPPAQDQTKGDEA